jgi:small GTP-binding protein
MDSMKYQDKFNIMIIGDEKVGKTAIFERYLKKTFLGVRKQTIGIEYYDKLINFDDKNYLFKVWDTAGQEKFRVMARSYYQKAHGMILTCSLDNRESFENLKIWLITLKECVGLEEIQLIILANKCDLDEERQVSEEEIKTRAKELGIEYFETSAKTGQNIDLAFQTIFKKVYSRVYKRGRCGFDLGDYKEGSILRKCC